MPSKKDVERTNAAGYANVPSELVHEIEDGWSTQLQGETKWEAFKATGDEEAKQRRLAFLRETRDKLSPYGTFKSWCADHDVPYAATLTQLSQAYGAVSKRADKYYLSGPSLLPAEAEEYQRQAVEEAVERAREEERKRTKEQQDEVARLNVVIAARDQTEREAKEAAAKRASEEAQRAQKQATLDELKARIEAIATDQDAEAKTRLGAQLREELEAKLRVELQKELRDEYALAIKRLKTKADKYDKLLPQIEKSAGKAAVPVMRFDGGDSSPEQLAARRADDFRAGAMHAVTEWMERMRQGALGVEAAVEELAVAGQNAPDDATLRAWADWLRADALPIGERSQRRTVYGSFEEAADVVTTYCDRLITTVNETKSLATRILNESRRGREEAGTA